MKKEMIRILAVAILFLFGISTSAYAFTAGYHSFNELAAAEDPADYSINVSNTGSSTTILAIHGGGIERGTSELVEALGGYGGYNTYFFEGTKPSGNESLFLRAVDFDEPEAASLVRDSDYTVSVIGAAGNGETTYIGGQNKLLAELIKLHLAAEGYDVKTLNVPSRIAGIMDSNIVNQNKLFNNYQIGGVQIALSKGLRDKFAADPGTLSDYSGAVNEALSESWPLVASQLQKIIKPNGNGFLDKYNPFKPNFDKKVKDILKKGAKTPKELIENAEE
ncbi:poly-gamma-glutamate hydrolase family protein [Sinanaerobacter chloroacetimidivorans]|uniref:Poly-gamma-glutamate hydrolase family protein n=1 Tax=Sinanaerobacter chloroacetimidivorans TaxID=2818044 RepID=A0A8J8B4C0_9FIRM|nr:poly-gamma-glutamate hydrolase family protein [Sinanaerobacter chloroacetimidivorans]MBR0600577.1 poly-gamma-glutamate hydrolase family protein [Sinanaerobacter chloroacetimidivorans]